MHFFLFVKFKISWNLKHLEFIPYFSMIMKKSVLTSQLYKLLEPISKIRLGFRARRGTVKKRSPAESGMSNTF